jgi:hypothetical protein
MRHHHTYFMGLIVGIAGLAGCDSSSHTARVNAEKEIVYEAQIVGDKALRLEPSADGKNLDKLGKLSFQQGSELFGAVLQAVETKGPKTRPIGPDPTDPPTVPRPKPGPGPDPIDPPEILILKNPLGLLSGKEPLPWKLLNPAAAAGCKCKIVCTYLEDRRIDCIKMCTGTGCD